jgi:glycosyltransferase involved in cell wall biosynthesis
MSKSIPIVSIVIPTLNQGAYLRECIESVLNQDYPNIEIYVVDGVSSDSSLEILAGYASRISWISEKDHGQTEAINKGMRLTHGEICGFLNSDDTLNPGAVSRVMTTFSDKRVLWVTGDYAVINANGKHIQKLVVIYKRVLRLFSSKLMISLANYIVQPSTFWRRELFEKIGYFDESLSYVMDYDFWMRAHQIQRPKNIPYCLSSFRIHSASKGGSHFLQQFDEEITVLKRYTRNPFILGLHRLHNQLITTVYKLIK